MYVWGSRSIGYYHQHTLSKQYANDQNHFGSWELNGWMDGRVGVRRGWKETTGGKGGEKRREVEKNPGDWLSDCRVESVMEADAGWDPEETRENKYLLIINFCEQATNTTGGEKVNKLWNMGYIKKWKLCMFKCVCVHAGTKWAPPHCPIIKNIQSLFRSAQTIMHI